MFNNFIRSHLKNIGLVLGKYGGMLVFFFFLLLLLLLLV
jgi:hypothetical protein